MNRSGFQIAASTLVVLILGLFIVGGGFYLVAKVTGDGERVATELTVQQQEQLQNLLQKGQLVALYPSYVEIAAGTDALVGFAVENRLPEEHEFEVIVNVLAEDGTAAHTTGWIFVYPGSVVLDRNERQELPIVIRPVADAEPGEYTVIVTATLEDGAVYDTPRFFAMRVR